MVYSCHLLQIPASPWTHTYTHAPKHRIAVSVYRSHHCDSQIIRFKFLIQFSHLSVPVPTHTHIQQGKFTEQWTKWKAEEKKTKNGKANSKINIRTEQHILGSYTSRIGITQRRWAEGKVDKRQEEKQQQQQNTTTQHL